MGDMILNFAYNPTSWNEELGEPVPGGMADCLIKPILPHLESDYILTDRPLPGHANVYYTFRRTYRLQGKPAGERSIFVSHGIADKNWRNSNKVGGSSGFNHIFVSGPAWTYRLKVSNVNKRRIIEVGYTKLDPIFNGEIEDAWPKESEGKIRVLWAPTHGGGGEGKAQISNAKAGARRSTHHHRELILDALDSDEFYVVEACHPRHRPDGKSTLQEYVGADVVIADGGSTIYEAWALGLPVVFPTWLTGSAMTYNRRTFEAEIYRDKVGRHCEEPEHLGLWVEKAAEQGITGPEEDYVEDILPREYRGISGRLHAEALDEIIWDQVPRRASNFLPHQPMTYRRSHSA